jgi:hypothetical protein
LVSGVFLKKHHDDLYQFRKAKMNVGLPNFMLKPTLVLR